MKELSAKVTQESETSAEDYVQEHELATFTDD
jgi:hypothetical protein